MEALLANPLFLFIIGFIGMVSSFLEQYKTNSKKIEIKTKNIGSDLINYFFKTDLINTIKTFFAYIVVYFAMYKAGEVGIVATFSTGYMANSLFNKAKAKGLSVG